MDFLKSKASLTRPFKNAHVSRKSVEVDKNNKYDVQGFQS